MIALGILILILILILLLPVGVDVGYIDNVLTLKAKAGPFKIALVPAKEEDREKKENKSPKRKKEKSKASATDADKKPKAKLKLAFDDVMTIIRIALSALGRFRRSIKVEKLMLHFLAAGPDPYSAVMNYGYFNAAIGGLRPLLHRAFRIKDEDFASAIDFEADKLKIEGRIVLTVRIGEILFLVLCAAFGFLKWFLSHKHRTKAQAKENEVTANNEKITENSSAEKGN